MHLVRLSKFAAFFAVALVLLAVGPAAAAEAAYRLGAGDRVKVTVFGQEDLSGEFELDGGGRLSLPLIQRVQAAGLTTLTGSVARTIEEVTSSRASGRTTTRAGITADHELLRNLLLNASVFGIRRDYEGIDRVENDAVFELGGKYMMNRNLYTSLNYSLHFRDTSQSGGGGRDFLVNSVMLRIQTQF